MTSHVALLRGINLGGKNSLPMKTLVAIFQEAGCEDVTTYIQSGNVLFKASASLASRLPSVISETLQQKLGLKVPVLIRSTKALCALARRNPFVNKNADAKTLHVVFLRDKPSAALVRSLKPGFAAPDAFSVAGQEVFLHCPNGYGRSRLTPAYFDKALQSVCSVRNWRTVTTLCDLAAGQKA